MSQCYEVSIDGDWIVSTEVWEAVKLIFASKALQELCTPMEELLEMFCFIFILEREMKTMQFQFKILIIFVFQF